MNDLKQLLDSYNICARFAPGFLFIISICFLLGYDIKNFKSNSIFSIALLIILSGVCGFVSASIIKFAERFIWDKFNNPIIRYLKKKEKELYRKLLDKYKDTKEEKEINNFIVAEILKCTREDNKTFWKNISYGFFRNSILLSFIRLLFSYSSKYCQYFYINIAIFLFILLMTFISAGYYAHQIIESYKEITLEDK